MPLFESRLPLNPTSDISSNNLCFSFIETRELVHTNIHEKQTTHHTMDPRSLNRQ